MHQHAAGMMVKMSPLDFAGDILARLGLDVTLANHACLEMHEEGAYGTRKIQLRFAVVAHKTHETKKSKHLTLGSCLLL